jgi:hypothetical protein
MAYRTGVPGSWAPMRDTLTCSRCGGGEVLAIATVQELEWEVTGMAVVRSLDGTRTLGELGVHICRACGLTEWRASRLEHLRTDDELGVNRVRATSPCSGCKSREEWRVFPMREVGAGFPLDPVPMGILPRYRATAALADNPLGRLETRICDRCGHTRWYAHQFDELKHREEARPIGMPCVECNHPEALEVSPLRDVAQSRSELPHRHVYFQARWLGGHRGRGHFDAQVCTACGLFTWVAKDIQALAHDPAAGIRILKRPTPPDGGPYR